MTPQARAIIVEVARSFRVEPAKISSVGRKQALVLARVEVARRLDARGYSTSKIGTILQRDHTTIVYYLGRGKRAQKPPPVKWRKPRIAHLKCRHCRRCYFPGPKPETPEPTKCYLVPYAGAFMPEYDWRERLP